MNLSKKLKLAKASKLASCIKAGLFATSGIVSLNVSAETYDFNFGQNGLATFDGAQLSGSGKFELFDFSERFKLGTIKSPRVNLRLTTVNLGDYGFKAGGYVNGSSSIAYDYNFGEHSFDLDIPMSIDLNVSAIDANNRVTISSAYSLGRQSGLTPTVDTNSAFFNIDPTFNLAAGGSVVACVVKCSYLINESFSVNAFKENLIDIHASDLSVTFDRNSSNAKVGSELSEFAGLFGVNTTGLSQSKIGSLARNYGLLALDVHTPGLDFNQIQSSSENLPNSDAFTLASSGEDEFFHLKLDMVDLAASSLLSGAASKVTKLLDKEISTTVGGQKLVADWELADVEVSTSASLVQDFNFEGTPTIQLALSDGQNLTMNAGQSIVVQLAAGTDSINIDPTFGLAGLFSSQLDLKLEAAADLNLLGYNFDLPLSKIKLKYGLDLGDFGVGNINQVHAPTSVHQEFSTQLGLYSSERQLEGLSSFTGARLSSDLPSVDGLGTHGNDVLKGTYANDSLMGLGGNDILIGGLGSDLLDGGDGIDTADYRSYTEGGVPHLQTGQGVTVHLFSGIATSTRPDEPFITDTDTLTSIENINGSRLSDTLNGDNNSNVLRGHDGNDTLRGYAGNDAIYGGGGNDYIRGGNGHDILVGGNGVDHIIGDNGNDYILDGSSNRTLENDIYNGSAGIDTVEFTSKYNTLSGPLKLPGLFGINADLSLGTAKLNKSRRCLPIIGCETEKLVTLLNIENVIGTNKGDRIIGDSGNNVLDGRNGTDYIDGGDGQDTLIYSAGNDTYVGGAGIDVLDASFYKQSVDIDQRNANISIENVIGSKFDDTLNGDDENNVIDGYLGSDYVNAQGGDDLIIVRNSGKAVVNTVVGGTGNDAVVLSEAVEKQHVVVSYNQQNLELNLNNGHSIILAEQYQDQYQATESFYGYANGEEVSVAGSFESLVGRGDFGQYQIKSNFTTSENMQVSTRLDNLATLTNQNTLTNEGVLESNGTLINNGRLENRGTLILSNTFNNNGVFVNTNTGRTHYTSSNVLAGEIYNDGLIDVKEGENLNITGSYFGSGFLVGDIAFNTLTMNIGNSPGTTNLFGSASFTDVDFNLEIGQDAFGSLEYDIFNVFGDFTLGSDLSVNLFLLDGLDFSDLIDTDFNFINVDGGILDAFNTELSLTDLIDYNVEIIDGFFANWTFEDGFGYSLSFNGTDLFLANGGVLPTEPSDVPAPKTLSLLFASMLIMLWRRKSKVLN